MTKSELKEIWEKRTGPITFTTVDLNGKPNSIYVLSIWLNDDGNFVIADNYFNKTKANIFETKIGAILFLTEEHTSIQIKGKLEYFKEGPYYTYMKQNNKSKFPGIGATLFTPTEFYKGT